MNELLIDTLRKRDKELEAKVLVCKQRIATNTKDNEDQKIKMDRFNNERIEINTLLVTIE